MKNGWKNMPINYGLMMPKKNDPDEYQLPHSWATQFSTPHLPSKKQILFPPKRAAPSQHAFTLRRNNHAKDR